MTTALDDTYTVPDDPADPETAALELIVRVPRRCARPRLAAAGCVAGLRVAAARRKLLRRPVLA